MTRVINISPKKVAIGMTCVVLIIALLSLTGQYFRDSFIENEFITKVIGKLNLDAEKNSLPTWYQSSTMLFSSLLLMVIGLSRLKLKDKNAKYWGFLSVIFLYLSLDESISIHEQMTMPLRNAFHFEGFLYLSWVIPASFLMILFGLFFARFLFRLPPQTRNLMILSGIIFLTGAVGVEMIGANYLFLKNDPPGTPIDFTYAMITTVEELFEMFGILLFNYELLCGLSEPHLVTATEPENVGLSAQAAAG